MDPELTLRTAAVTDAEAVARLSAELGYPVAPGEMAERLSQVLSSASDLLVVAEIGGQVVGWVQAHGSWVVETGLRVEIAGLVVAAEVRRAGVGRALAAQVERWAAASTASTVVVRSNALRTESHTFYPAIGYQFVKTQRVYLKRCRA